MTDTFDSIRRLEPSDERPSFDCGDSDLNEFFLKDSIKSSQQLLSVTYTTEKENATVGFFCLSNDSIRKEDTSKSKLKRMLRIIPREKRYKSMPAVKIGRLATHKDFQCAGIGTAILDYIKFWFTVGNKTGCRFIIVDAYNNSRTIKFYRDNGFEFLIPNDDNEETRLMYFDLITFRE